MPGCWERSLSGKSWRGNTNTLSWRWRLPWRSASASLFGSCWISKGLASFLNTGSRAKRKVTQLLELVMAKKEQPLRKMSLPDAVSEAFAEFESLGSEMREWADNLEEKFSTTEKYNTVSSTADTL